MGEQLSFLSGAPAPPLPTDLPPAVAEIVRAARSIAFQARVVRGAWGVGVGTKRRWVLTGDCCCPLGALLVVKGVQAKKGDRSPVCAAARLLGVAERDVLVFMAGFDGLVGGGSVWFEYGRRVAEELSLRSATSATVVGVDAVSTSL